MRNLTKRLAATAASIVAATAGAVAVGASPSYALATCPDKHVCFFKDFHYNGNNTYSPAGTMSDQTNALFKPGGALISKVETDDGNINNVGVWGKISDFRNSRYTNGDKLQDSVSFVVNNSDVCLVLYRDVNFVASNSLSYSVISFGPHTTRALAGAKLGNDDNEFSSAFTVGVRGDLCSGVRDFYEPL
nr:hypothetical protein [uncultured Actinoplanes sp.]